LSYVLLNINIALKLGYDVKKLAYPEWLLDILDKNDISRDTLPDVVEPGMSFSSLKKSIAKEFGIPNDCCVVGGTTDSIAAFIAAGKLCTYSRTFGPHQALCGQEPTNPDKQSRALAPRSPSK
jgi:ribulose kinase